MLAIGAAALVVAACGGDGEGAAKPQPSSAPTLAGTTEPPPATATTPPSPRGDTEAAELDADPALPGTYFPPHPGRDGVFPSDDDRDHLAEDTFVPICTQAQIDANDISLPLC